MSVIWLHFYIRLILIYFSYHFIHTFCSLIWIFQFYINYTFLLEVELFERMVIWCWTQWSSRFNWSLLISNLCSAERIDMKENFFFNTKDSVKKLKIIKAHVKFYLFYLTYAYYIQWYNQRLKNIYILFKS